jgi:RNA polymerase sigma factor (sigma-70 family)
MDEGVFFENKDRDQFEDWVELYFPMIRKLVIDKGGSKDVAEEIYQETMIVYFEKTKKRDFILTVKPSTYIYSIAVNKWREYIRKKNPANALKSDSDLDQIEYLEADEYDYEKDLFIKELQECIKKLSDTHREIIIKFYYFKKTMKEIAASSNSFTNDKNVKAQSWRAIQNLKKCMQAKKN